MGNGKQGRRAQALFSIPHSRFPFPGFGQYTRGFGGTTSTSLLSVYMCTGR